MLRKLTLAAACILLSVPALAQGPAPERRPQSEAQQRNTRIMRECGTEWRAAKDAGTMTGQTWRDFLRTCRTRKMV